jgi:DNA-binding transcriptional LysR family regulator
VQTVQALAAGDRGRLRIGYAPSLTMDVLPRALCEFEQRWPGVRVTLHDLSSEECLQRLAAGRIDLALTVPPGAARRRGLTFVRVKNYPPCCAVPARHPLARKRAIRLQDLRDRKFVVLSQEDYPEYRGWLQALFAPAGFDPRIALECDSATGLIAAVEAGRGIAIVPSSYACVASPRVRLLPFVPPPAPVVLGALSTRPPAPWAEPFIAVLRSSV